VSIPHPRKFSAHAILSAEETMSQLSPVQSNVLAGLLAGKSISAVARENDIHRSTIYLWRREHPYFNIALAEARSHHRTAMYDFVRTWPSRAWRLWRNY
jgi:hypothetical protein